VWAGHVAHYLHRRGVDVLGIDVSAGMIDEARRRYPQVHFETGDIRSLSHDDHTFGTVVATYSLHFNENELAPALREIHRVLSPEASSLQASIAVGSPVTSTSSSGNASISTSTSSNQIQRAFTAAAVEIERQLERGAYPNIEAQTDRLYVIARVPDSAGTTSAGQMQSIR
jgi:ubiquinone/menaquinone biosynthesis C-methylase UbiE